MENDMRELGFDPPRAHGAAASGSQLTGGVLLIGGLLTPVACTVCCSTMLTALWSKNVANGFFNRNGGVEYPLLLTTGVLVVAAEGPGPLSLDRLLGIDRSGGQTALLTLGVASAGSLGVYALTRRPASEPEQAPTAA
jgi:putative oxidoreductase